MRSFCMIFPWKCFSFNTVSMTKVSMPYLFFFSKHQIKCVIKFLFRQLMTSETLRFILDQPFKQCLTGRKRGEDRNTLIEISQERKGLSRWRASICWKIKISQKLAGTSFNFTYCNFFASKENLYSKQTNHLQDFPHV